MAGGLQSRFSGQRAGAHARAIAGRQEEFMSAAARTEPDDPARGARPSVNACAPAANVPACRWLRRRRNCKLDPEGHRGAGERIASLSSAGQCTCAGICAVMRDSSARRRRGDSSRLTRALRRVPTAAGSRAGAAGRAPRPIRAASDAESRVCSALRRCSRWPSGGCSLVGSMSVACRLRRRRMPDSSPSRRFPRSPRMHRWPGRPSAPAAGTAPVSPSPTPAGRSGAHREDLQARDLRLANEAGSKSTTRTASGCFMDVGHAGSVQSWKGAPRCASCWAMALA